MNRAQSHRYALPSFRLLSMVALSAALTLGCGDDDRPPSTGGMGGFDGGGASGGSSGSAGDSGMMDASMDSSMFDARTSDARPDDDSGVVDAGGPMGWLCRDNLWSDGVCDCGCGVFDVDCPSGASCTEPGCTASACEACFDPLGRWMPCDAPVWSCNAAELNDPNGFCDCGCGAPDPDCRGQGCTTASCRAAACDRCHDDTSGVIGCEVPIEWNCDPGQYGGSDGCDCGCGTDDPDCDGAGCTVAGCTDTTCDVCHNGSRAVRCDVPSAWSCHPGAYASDDGCDCGCGVPDPDCDGGGCEGNGCSEASCTVCHYDALVGSCSIPTGWTCEPFAYAVNGVCNCGCGVDDPDCGSGGCTTPGCREAQCDLCHDANNDVSACAASSCGDRLLAGDGCDCGCGATDPDCLLLPSCTEPGCTMDTCNFCNSASGRVACGGWTCLLARYADGHCDCGCGAADPDCGSGGCTEPGCSAAACEQCFQANGQPASCEAVLCDPSVLGTGDGCDCGCDTVDPDCTGLSSCTQPGCTAFECARCHDPRGRLIFCP